jgi:hypothetical protein
MPAGPAPTMITSYFKGHCPPWNPKLDVITGIYLLVSVFYGRGELVILYVFAGGFQHAKYLLYALRPLVQRRKETRQESHRK